MFATKFVMNRTKNVTKRTRNVREWKLLQNEPNHWTDFKRHVWPCATYFSLIWPLHSLLCLSFWLLLSFKGFQWQNIDLTGLLFFHIFPNSFCSSVAFLDLISCARFHATVFIVFFQSILAYFQHFKLS